MQAVLSLKERRVALALSQNEVNRRCGFKPAFYALVERGTKTATEEQMAIINEVLGSAPPIAATPPATPPLLTVVRDIDGDAIAVVPTKVKRARKRAAVVAAAELAPPVAENMHPELARLSAAKLAETWTNRPAQMQVLKNIFHSLDHKATRVELESIKEQMKGKPLSAIANVVLAVLGMPNEVEM